MKTKPTKFVDRVAAAFGFSRMIEAVNHRSEERGWVYAQAQDSKVDLSSYDRTRLMALSRKCFYNNAIVRGAVRDKAMYSVGSGIGIRPQAMSGDQAWDDAAEAWWENWARSPEISGRHDMRSLQMLVSEAIDRDGEIFAVLTAKSDGAPAVQIVESHRIESPDTAANNNGVVDGVKLDKFQRPLGYFIGEGDEYPRRHREVKADVMLHVYEPERSDQVRGYPAIGVALNSVLDRDELLRFEMMAAKAGSSIGLVIKNATGNIGAEGFLGDFSKDSSGNLTRETIFGGGLVPRMKSTEDIQSFVMNRPNEKLDKHLEQYIRAAAIGLGLPYEFVWDTSAIGGVAQRFIIQKAARCFAARQDVLVNSFLSKLWRYAIARAISRRELPMVAGWQQVGWQTPRSITVDVGREAAARRDDVKAGLMTLADFFGEQGLDWKEAVAEIAAERDFAADLGVIIGVEQAQPQAVFIEEQETDAPQLEPVVSDPNGAEAETPVTDDGQAIKDAAASPTQNIDETALNGAQVQALLELAQSVARGEIPVESAKGIAAAAFPLLSQEILDRIFDSIEPKEIVPEQASEEAPAATEPQLESKEEPTELALPKKRKRLYRRKKTDKPTA